jgi:mandelate racemase
MATAPLVLVDLLTDEGVTGAAYAFCYMPAALRPVRDLVAALEPLVAGERVEPLALGARLRARFRLLGGVTWDEDAVARHLVT